MMPDVRAVQVADVYKAGRRAATLRRRDGGIVFAYDEGYDGPAVALTLPVSAEPRFTPAGSVPPFFAGLLPEGRRFSSLQRSLKTSADDELSLLLAVGADTIGDVVVVAQGAAPIEAPSLIEVQNDFTDIRFADLLAETGIVDAVGLPGVQDKVSARVISLPIATSHDRYILKLNPPEYPHVVENEAFFIGVAKQSQMTVVEAKLVFDADGVAGLLVRRFDRTASEAAEPRNVACEDACQVLDRWPGDKYNVTSEELASSVAGVCSSPSVAARDVVRQLCFAWLIGNGDVHAKNISVLQQESGEWRVSPVYDLPSTLFYDDYSMALPIGGRTDGLSRRRWLDFAESIELPRPAAERVIDELLMHTVNLCDEIAGGALPFTQKTLHDAVRNMANRRKLLEP
jgi:serine/threonine-protein kinase HipA